MFKKKSRIKLGWREWCELSDLGIPAVKTKVDTGAKTSALHAFAIEVFEAKGERFVRFKVHPIQKNTKITVSCAALLIDMRNVKSSAGHEQERYVIRTPVRIGRKSWEIEITLTRRDSMGYRMLLGREAMKRGIVIEPEKSFIQGKISAKKLADYYKN